MDKKEIINKLENLDNKIKTILPKGKIELPPIDSFILAIFKSCLGYYKSVILLLKKDMVQESKIILRTLMETSIRLSYLANTPECRISLICGMALKEDFKWLKMSEQAHKMDLEPDINEIINIVKKREEEIKDFLDKNNTNKKNFPTVSQMASELNMKEAYINYQILSSSVHNSFYSYLSRINTKNARQNSSNKPSNHTDTYAVAIESAEWILNACISLGLILNIDKLQNLSQLGIKGDDIFKNI